MSLPKLRFSEFIEKWKDNRLGVVSDSISSGKDKSDPDGVYDLYGSTGVIGKTSSDTYNGKFILVARVGANAGLLTKTNGRFGVTDNTLIIQLKKPDSIDFVFYYLESLKLNKLIFGSGQPLITGGQLKALHFFLPDDLEQQKIADCLSSISDRITLESQKLDTLKVHKKGLMQQLFPAEGETLPKLRFPEFFDAEGWEEKKLGDVCKIQRGKFSHRPRNEPKFFGGKYPFIQTGDVVKASGGIVQASQSLNELGLTVSKLFKPTIVLITIAANIGDTGILDYEACFTDSVAGLIPNDRILPYFLELVMRDKKDYLNTIAPQAAQKNINNEILHDVDILVPLLSEQQKIADCFSSLDELIAAQAQAIATLKTHKKGLMQQLFPSVDEVKG